jgi:endoglucanase
MVIPMLTSCGGADSSSGDGAGPSAGPQSAEHFLDTYVAEDGRVIRTDQGGDVVSEGQAYGMLVAELAGRPELVTTIWGWTKEHLLRDDGLLSWHASAEGTVTSTDAASDADVLAAYALLRYDGPDPTALHDDGSALAQAVLDHEVFWDQQGRSVLSAGQWAPAKGIVNPSYLMPGVFEDLARLTGDDTWSALADSSTQLVGSVTQDGTLLPPDWARLDGTDLVPVADASGSSGDAQYGPDAQRVPLWFAFSCDHVDRRLAAAWWSLLQQDDRSSALALSTSGDVLDADGQPVALLASAASATAAGDHDGADDLLRGAGEAAQGSPCYYGDAWLALAEALRGGALTSCGP